MPSDQTRIHSQTPYQGLTCGACSSELIQPLQWERVGSAEWRVLIRCPECFGTGTLHLTQEQATLFQNALDEATHSLEQMADALDREVFRSTCDSFTKALRADLICPTDF